MGATRPLVVVRNVTRRFGDGAGAVWALRDVSLTVAPAELVTIMGPSGSGKSTLLNLVAGIDEPDTGTVEVDGNVLARMRDAERARLRRRTVAFVFQAMNLLPTLTAAQNVAVPLRADGMPARTVAERVASALAHVGLTARAGRYPAELSGGEMQRTAIARALATDARLILADEPTGNLDSRTSLEIMALFQQLNRERGLTIVLVTHEPDIAAYASRVVVLRDGLMVEDKKQEPQRAGTMGTAA